VGLPSLIWLDTVEHLSTWLPKTLYPSSDATCVSIGSIKQWERRVLSGPQADSFDHTPSQVVESASQIMQGIAQGEGDFDRNLGDKLQAIRDVASLRINIGLYDVTVGVPESVDCHIEVVNVFLGPIVFS
jgi:hypothetical protein